MKRKRWNDPQLWVRIGAIVAIIALMIVAVRRLPVVQYLEQLEAWMDVLGPFAPLMFAAIYIVAGSLFVPDLLLRLAAGAFLGLFWGVLVSSVSLTVVAAIGFLIGRYFARGAIQRNLERFPRFAAVDKAIGEKGWKVVAVLRLVPFYPYNLGNYALGLTSISFWPYLLATWAARLPSTIVVVYFGHVGRVTLESAARGQMMVEPLHIALLGIGLVAAIAATIYITIIARRAIAEYMDENDEAGK